MIKVKPLWKKPIYKLYHNMIQRCKNLNNPRYGGRGIGVSQEWNIFDKFYSDMGDIPFKGAELDRIDNDKGYSKENCRWVSKSTNNANKETRNKKFKRGVRKRGNVFQSQISVGNKTYNIGHFPTELGASKAYNKMFFEWYGFSNG